MYDTRSIYTLQEAIQFIEMALKEGFVTISRWSNTSFEPLVQKDSITVRAYQIKEKGQFAFIKGMENTRALNHKNGKWYKTTLYSEAKISIQEKIKTASYEVCDHAITVEDYLYYFLDIYHQLLKKYKEVSWNDMGFCNGIYLPEEINITDIVNLNQPIWDKEVYRNQLLILKPDDID